MIPLVSVSRHWSTESAISSPATGLPDTMCAPISFRVRLSAMAVPLPGLDGHEGATAVPDVVRPGPDQPVVGVLLEEVGRPAGDPRGGDDRREQVHRDADRVEQR